jgi:hypothetical protein
MNCLPFLGGIADLIDQRIKWIVLLVIMTQDVGMVRSGFKGRV